jgi:Ca-activated chloride channel family protein
MAAAAGALALALDRTTLRRDAICHKAEEWMLVRTLLGTSLCLSAFGLAACQKASNGARDSARDAPSSASEGTNTVSSEAQAYVARFTQKDPGECFRDVALEDVRLKGRRAGPSQPVPTRVLIMIDGSGSMRGRIGGTTKLDLARKAARDFIDAMPASIQASLLVFGQDGSSAPAGKAKSCAGISLLSPLTTDHDRLRSALDQVQAVGWTPLAAGLERAETLLSGNATPGEQVIYVVSDGKETCGGDPVAVARRINAGRTRAIVNVIGFDLPVADAQALTSVARAGGGDFVNVSSEAEMNRVTAEVREAVRRTDNDVATSVAATDNDVKTSVAITDADVCISNLATDEEVAMSKDLTDRDVRGTPVPFRKEAVALLRTRHDAMKARFESFRSRLSQTEQDAKDRIDNAADAAM